MITTGHVPPSAATSDMACIDLAALYGDHYRVGFQGGTRPRQSVAGSERPWHLEIRCRYGRVYPRGGDVLAAWTDHPRIGARLRRLPFILSAQGDAETVVTFHVGDAGAVLAILRPYRRRLVTAAQRERLRRIGAASRFGQQRGTHEGYGAVEPTQRPGPTAEARAASPDTARSAHRKLD